MDDRDFNEVYERNYRRSFLFAKSFVHDDWVAEDIAVESLFKYWQYCKESAEQVSESVLLAILKNASIDHLRKERNRYAVLETMEKAALARDVEIQLSSLEACDPNEVFAAEIRQIVRETLEQLPDQTRRIFIMSRFDNKSVKEIAEEWRISPKTVEYHITKSLKTLRVNLKDYLPLFLFLGGM